MSIPDGSVNRCVFRMSQPWNWKIYLEQDTVRAEAKDAVEVYDSRSSSSS